MREDVSNFRFFQKSSSYSADEKTENDDEDEEENETPLLS